MPDRICNQGELGLTARVERLEFEVVELARQLNEIQRLVRQLIAADSCND